MGEGARTLQEKRKKAAKEREVEDAKPTITYLWERYYENNKQKPSMRTDKVTYRHLSPFYEKKATEITKAEAKEFMRKLEAEGKAPQTVKHILELLRRLMRYGASSTRKDSLDLYELNEICAIPMPTVDNQKTECLTPEQANDLMRALDAEVDQNLAALVRLALATGMRRGALLGLKWDDLDFFQNSITLRGESAKNGKTTQIPMTTAARAVLERVQPFEGSPYVFPGRN